MDSATAGRARMLAAFTRSTRTLTSSASPSRRSTSSVGMRAGIDRRLTPRIFILLPMPAAERRPPVPADRLRLGLILPTWTTTELRWPEVLEIAGSAADVGFDALYVSDHLL